MRKRARQNKKKMKKKQEEKEFRNPHEPSATSRPWARPSPWEPAAAASPYAHACTCRCRGETAARTAGERSPGAAAPPPAAAAGCG